MYAQDRAQNRNPLRQVFFRAWQRQREQLPLVGIERIIASVALRHPEYHAVLENRASHEDHDFSPHTSQTNPFLHMGMHIAIEEQLAVDQPSGICVYYQTLLKQGLDAHEAQHRIMDCLGEMLSQAERHAGAPDFAVYLACLARLCDEPQAVVNGPTSRIGPRIF